MFAHQILTNGFRLTIRNNGSVRNQLSSSNYFQSLLQNVLRSRQFTSRPAGGQQKPRLLGGKQKQTLGKSNKAENNEQLIVLGNRNLRGSPMKWRFLVRLIRDKWMPDALAQMKFTPKRNGVVVAKVLRRGVAIAGHLYNKIAEELWVKEVITPKGQYRKKIRYHGKGQAGVGTVKFAHLRIVVKVLDIDREIATAKTLQEKKDWIKRKALIETIRKEKNMATPTTIANTLATN